MTMHVSRATHSIFFRLSPGDVLPDALFARLRDAAVATGTLRAHGVLEHVELRTFAPHTRTFGSTRAIAGAVHAITIEGTVGLSEGMPQAPLRAVLSRETDSGVETMSGVITSARVVALEVTVTSAQDLAVPLVHEARAGLAMIAEAATSSAAAAPPASPAPPPAKPVNAPSLPAAWTEAIATSDAQAGLVPASGGPGLKPVQTGSALPSRPPARPTSPSDDSDHIFPEAGDQVQHFAFGPCEVLRSDGDRLHLKVAKDGRIREIALEMLKVTLLDEDASARPRHFRLDRRL